MTYATTERKRKRPPIFTVYEKVEIEVDPRDLERAGWRYVGDENTDVVTEENAVDVVRRWHDETHPGPWQWCEAQPCDTLRGRSQG
jgi:hypothetical protein